MEWFISKYVMTFMRFFVPCTRKVASCKFSVGNSVGYGRKRGFDVIGIERGVVANESPQIP